MKSGVKIPADILNYIDKHWKPNQDDNYILVEKNSEYDKLLKGVFDSFYKMTPDEKAENSFNVGPFIGIKPYGYFDDEENPKKREYLFEYESIDRKELKSHHLTIF